MKRSLSLFPLLFMGLTLACGQGERRQGESAGSASRRSNRPLTIKGSDTMVILGQRFAEEYMKTNPGTVVQVNGGGSGTGIAALVNGSVDLAQSSRPMKDAEKADVKNKRGAAVVETPVALDAIGVFVHAANPVKQLSIDPLAKIFTGKIKNWKEVGGANAPIVLYGRENSSGTYDYFREHVLGKADFSSAVQTLQGTAAVINAVSRDKNGIGYGGIAYARDVRALAVQKDASTPAVAPTEATVLDNSYPISRKLFFYSLQNAPERVTQFIEWTLSPAGQELVSKVGYFPLRAEGAGAATGASPTTTAAQ